MRFTNEQLRNIGYKYDPKTNTAIRLDKVGQQTQGRTLGSSPKAQKKCNGKCYSLVRQKHKVLIRLEAYAVYPLDPPNLSEAAKYCVDSIVANGLLEDDSYQHCEVYARCIKVKCKEDERLEITLELLAKEV